MLHEMKTREEELREVIINAIIEAIKAQDKSMMEALSWLSHPITLQINLNK